jgi:hypothetical protein
MAEFKWEELKKVRGGSLMRAKVPGGWLVYFQTSGLTYPTGGLTFYPDPKHEWDGGTLP